MSVETQLDHGNRCKKTLYNTFNGLRVNLNALGGKLNADGRLGIEIEFVSGEPREQVGFADSRVSNEDHCELNTNAKDILPSNKSVGQY